MGFGSRTDWNVVVAPLAGDAEGAEPKDGIALAWVPKVYNAMDLDSISTSEATELLSKALTTLFVEDQDLPHDANERTWTHRLAFWIEVLLRERGWDFSVDCEYNRNGVVPKRLHRTLLRQVELLGSAEEILTRPTARTVFPDIVIHRRGSAGPNLIVIEVKREGADRDEVAVDCEKLRLYVSEFGYRHAFFVTLGPSRDRTEVRRVGGRAE